MTVNADEFKEFKDSTHKRFVSLESALAKNTEITQKVAVNTAEVVDAFDSAKGAFKVLEFLGKMAKPLIWIVGLGTTLALNVTTLKASFISFMANVFK